MRRNIVIIVSMLLFILIITGCADTNNVKQCVTGHTYGFWGGLLHGIIAPLSFIGSLFSDDIAIWAQNNNRRWYSFGFLLGIGGFSIGSSKASKGSHKVFTCGISTVISPASESLVGFFIFISFCISHRNLYTQTLQTQ